MATQQDNRPAYAAKNYCVGFEQQAAFLPRLHAHALQMALDDPSCQQIVLVGDGAHWIWEHNAAHLHVAGKALVKILVLSRQSTYFGDGEDGLAAGCRHANGVGGGRVASAPPGRGRDS